MIRLYHGHVIDVLRGLGARSVHACVTSPPYWSLRDYDLPPVEWPTVTYRPMAGMAEVRVQGCEAGCEHEWIPLGTKEAKALAWKMRASLSIHQIKRDLATTDIEVNDKASSIGIEVAAEPVINKESMQAIGKVSASSREGCSPSFADAPIAIEDTPDKIPDETIRNVRDMHCTTLSGMNPELGKSISQRCRPDTPSISNPSSADVLNADRGLGGNKSLDESDQALIFADEADSTIVSDVSIGQHQADEISEIGRPGSEIIPKDRMPVEPIGSAPLVGTNFSAELMSVPFETPRGAQDNSTAKLALNGDSGISTGTGAIPPLPNAGRLDAESSSATLTDKNDTHNVPSICKKCGGVKCSLGLEPSPQMYVAHLVAVCREIWRVLRDDGTFWLNLGDSYAGSSNSGGTSKRCGGGMPYRIENLPKAQSGLQQKQLMGIPWRVALALQADGWIFRSDVIWAKGISFCPTYSGSCMPESCRDRPTKAHEYLFLLTKRQRYFYDQEAVKETSQSEWKSRGGSLLNNTGWHKGAHGITSWNGERTADESTRNLRTVWAINPGSYKEAHFATFPPALIEPCIKAGTSERGVCPSCGAPWERVTERRQDTLRPKSRPVGNSRGLSPSDFRALGQPQQGCQIVHVTTISWQPACECFGVWENGELVGAVEEIPDPVPATVLDPFSGAATALLEADRLGRDGIGIELNGEYVKMGADRIRGDAPLFAQVEVMA